MSGSVSKHSQMTPMGRAVRAYVAPINRTTEAFVPFDPAIEGLFDLNAPPPPLLDLGWVENFKRTTASKFEPLHSGLGGLVAAQYRPQTDALIEFDLPAWGKLQMAVAGGSQPLNLLATGLTSPPLSSGGTAVPAVYPQDGSDRSQLAFDPATLAYFNVGDVMAVDADYTGQAGYLGAGIPGTYLAAPLDAATHVDLIRRVTFNIAKVTGKTTFALQLTPMLPAGYQPGYGAQKIAGFVDREGSRFVQEWSALFVVPCELGGRILFFYPRVQAAAAAGEKAQDFAAPLFHEMLHAALRAFPTVDPNDGETVLCYRSYIPPVNAAAY